MSSIVFKKIKGNLYAYEITSYREKSTKKVKQHCKYLGVVTDKEKGEYKRARSTEEIEKEINILDYGDTNLIKKLLEDHKIQNVLNANFSKKERDMLLSLICFQLNSKLSAMKHVNNWYEGNIASMFFPDARLTSQAISKFISYIGDTNLQMKFFKHYFDVVFERKTHGVLIDGTHLPSSISNNINSWGYTSSGIQKNISCLMITEKKSNLPLYFRYLSGDIPDISTLKNTITEAIKIGIDIKETIFDAGFYSEENLKFLAENKIQFLSRLPAGRRLHKELTQDNYNGEVKDLIKYGKRLLFIREKEVTVGDIKAYAYVILDYNKKNSCLKDLYTEYTEGEKTLEELDENLKRKGIYVLISNFKINREQVLPLYYSRQMIEQMFGFAKSELDILPLRVRTDKSISGYLFLSFLTLIVYTILRKKLNTLCTPEEALAIMRNQKVKVYKNGDLVEQEMNKKQKDILGVLVKKGGV